MVNGRRIGPGGRFCPAVKHSLTGAGDLAAMKVTGPGPVSSQTTARASRAEGGFNVSRSGAGAAGSAAAPVAGAGGVNSVAALLALQAEDGPEERRRKAIRRGGGLLDRLDAVKLALLEGGDGSVALQALARAAAEERHSDPDPGLQAVLDQIETRAAVELAKVRYRTPA